MAKSLVKTIKSVISIIIFSSTHLFAAPPADFPCDPDSADYEECTITNASTCNPGIPVNSNFIILFGLGLALGLGKLTYSYKPA